MRGKDRKRRLVLFIISSILTGIGLVVPVSVKAAFLPLYGGPTYDGTTGTGYRDAQSPKAGSGFGLGYVARYDSGTIKDYHAVRWDISGNFTDLGILDYKDTVKYSAWYGAIAFNDVGTIVVSTTKYVAGKSQGPRPIRWNISGTVGTELDNLGTDSTGFTVNLAGAINDAGTIVGNTNKYDDQGTRLGTRAVRWGPSNASVTELGTLGTDVNGSGQAGAGAINTSGTAVGWGTKYVAGNYMGDRAVRWDPTATAATELGNLGTSNGFSDGSAFDINDTGTAVGYMEKNVSGLYKGYRAVRWNASGTAATELGNLGTDANGETWSAASVINSAGTAGGIANKYVGGVNKGARAVRWDASGTTATELGNLGADASGVVAAISLDGMNDAGIAIGYAEKYDSFGNDLGQRAVMWGANGAAIDLNTLIDPSSGWVLTYASSISNDNWVTGVGSFDPDGPGDLAAYDRLFLIQVPEPASMTLLVVVALSLLTRRRGSLSDHDT